MEAKGKLSRIFLCLSWKLLTVKRVYLHCEWKEKSVYECLSFQGVRQSPEDKKKTPLNFPHHDNSSAYKKSIYTHFYCKILLPTYRKEVMMVWNEMYVYLAIWYGSCDVSLVKHFSSTSLKLGNEILSRRSCFYVRCSLVWRFYF